MCRSVIIACTTSNDMWVKSKSVLNVMLEPKVDLHTVAIPSPRDRDWFGNDLPSNLHGANSTLFASTPWELLSWYNWKKCVSINESYVDNRFLSRRTVLNNSCDMDFTSTSDNTARYFPLVSAAARWFDRQSPLRSA